MPTVVYKVLDSSRYESCGPPGLWLRLTGSQRKLEPRLLAQVVDTSCWTARRDLATELAPDVAVALCLIMNDAAVVWTYGATER